MGEEKPKGELKGRLTAPKPLWGAGLQRPPYRPPCYIVHVLTTLIFSGGQDPLKYIYSVLAHFIRIVYVGLQRCFYFLVS